LRKLVSAELEDVLGAEEVLQTPLPKVVQVRPVR
jgi:hypothetical protein